MGSHASPPSPEAVVVFDALRRLVRFLRTSAVGSARGVSTAQLFVLAQLETGPASSIRELAGRTMTDPSSVSVVVAKLEARGLVAREPDPRDRRRTTLSLTPRGRRALARAPELPQMRIVAALASMPKARRREIARALEALVTAVGADAIAPEMFFEDGSREVRRAKR